MVLSCSGGSGGLGGKRKAGVVLVVKRVDPVFIKGWTGLGRVDQKTKRVGWVERIRIVDCLFGYLL